ncbi:MAG: hypothetical protein INR62_04275 [Rhodospirillales bacterium]|nr:hypothetical protein [Acetobacter sp.]
MFDSVDSLRSTAKRYRNAASRSQDRDVTCFLNAMADHYELKAGALEAQQKDRTVTLAWSPLAMPQVASQEPRV